MAEISISEGVHGRCTVYGPGLVVIDLTLYEAEAFIVSYRRVIAA